MTDEQFAMVRSLFDRVADLPESERERVLARVAETHPEVAERTRKLLAAPDHRLGELTGRLANELTAMAGRHVDRYRLVSLLGEGGMGEVWLAEQQEPIQRRVAMKMIRPGMDSRRVIARFEAERQALAQLSHPCIAQVLDAGMTGTGRPFFVMEYVKGTPIDQFCDEHRLGIHDRLQLMRRVCDGVQHAHDRAILHRDLKPSNILVVDSAEGPAPKIIDFGIAKALTREPGGGAMLTEIGQPVGTPEYMSPELLREGTAAADTRCDVYSLGVILHQLLAGTLPASDSSDSAARHRAPSTVVRRQPGLPEIAAARALRPATLVESLRGDLDLITGKALESDRERRYSSPRELADDIGRFLDRRPIAARPPTPLYLARRFVERHRFGVAVAGAFLILTMTGVVATGLAWRQALEAETEARREAATTDQAIRFLVGLFEGGDPEDGIGASATPLELVNYGVERLEYSEIDDPMVRTRLSQAIGEAYVLLGEYQRGVAILEETLAEQLRSLDPRHEWVTQTLERLAFAYWAHGPVDQAEVYQRRVWQTRAQQRGVDDPTTLEAGKLLVDILIRLQRMDEAEALALDLLHRAERDVATEPLALTLGNALVSIEFSRGNFEAAEARNLAILERQRRLLGVDHMTTGASELMQVRLLIQRRAFDEAEIILRRLWGPVHERFGPGHKAVPRLHTVYGDLRKGQERFDEAIDHYRAALEGFRGLLEPGHPDITRTAARLVELLYSQGRHAEAEALSRESMAGAAP